MTVRVWRAEPAEAPVVASLLAEFRDWQGREAPTDADLRHSVARLLVDPDTDYLLAASGGDDADAGGVCQLRYRYGLWYTGEDCWLEDLFVSEPSRGRGVGRALVEGAMARARERRCRRIDLDAASDNEAALALYGSFGFSSDAPGGGRLLLLRLRLPDS